MKKEIKVVDEKKGIVQVTTVDERWYVKPSTEEATGLPAYEFVPSVTWICESYPKGIGFYKWLADKGWDEAQALKEAAGDKGSKVHQAIAYLIDGGTVKLDNAFTDSSGIASFLTIEEYEAILSFVDWVKDTKPKFLQREFAVWGNGYAGTVDLLCEIEGKVCLVDLKTSQDIWPTYEIQVSAYRETFDLKPDIAILQLGYRRNKKRYKFTEIEPQFDLFLAAKRIWEKDNKGKKPAQKDLPLEINLG